MRRQFKGKYFCMQHDFNVNISIQFIKIINMFDKAKDLYKLQKQAREIKKKLKNIHIEAESNGIVIIINGEQEVQKVTINEESMKNQKDLQSNLEKAFNKAIKKSQQIGAEMMKEVMGDMNFPGLG